MPTSGQGTSSGSLDNRLRLSLASTHDIEREIEGGGMARVYLATERALGRRVVVKVLWPELAHEISAERFAREVKLAARLQHPNIVPVLTAGTVEAVPFYIMPFIDGDTLRARMRGPDGVERLPLTLAIDILRDIARGLAYAHSVGVVHRDIKPENVLLSRGAAVVADFGIAKAVDAARLQDGATLDVALTRTGTAVGTPAYMAPEQAAGDRDADHRVDIYSWGILAYELLTGQHPFATHGSAQALMAAHFAESPGSVRAANPDVPPHIDRLVQRCMAKVPADRPASADEVIEQLTATDESSMTMGLARGRASRHRRVLIAGAIIVVAGLVTGKLMMNRTSATTGARARSSAESAMEAYLRGKIRAGNENPVDNTTAIAALREAVSLDPKLAPAYAELSRAYSIRAFYFAADSEKGRLLEDAQVTVEKALSLDPNLAEAHFARGLYLWTPSQRFPHEEAVSAYKRSIALNPNLSEVRHQLALVYLHIGLLDDAKAQIDTALLINPANSLARFRRGVVALYEGNYERARTIFNGTPLERSPSMWGFQMATAEFRLGKEVEATTIIDRYLREFPGDEGGVGNSVKAMIAAKHGRRQEAEALIAAALRAGRNFGHFHHTAYNVASAYALLGDRDKAIQYLETAADDGFPCYPLYAADAHLNALRGHPRFVALLARLERDWKDWRRRL